MPVPITAFLPYSGRACTASCVEQLKASGLVRRIYLLTVDDLAPLEANVVGNYAVQISWPDGFSQVATFEQILKLDRIEVRDE